ncbi:hypothetical protein TE10_17825 [Raoultella ornithinolytica]|uniref:lysozyme inhibitor LprI family protein n=1 Tax=Raoultella ornithinolytica TaxID=54291 RepID=UPI000598309E|nr:hypothetical protein TE10_17825 [Raoultella ornithinolytica]
MKKVFILLLCLPVLAYADLGCDNIQVSDQVYQCSKQSLETNDAKLNQEYKKILGSINTRYSSHVELRDEYIKKIKISQRAWVDFRDKNCEVLSYQIDAGTQAYETSMNTCKDKMTQERIKELEIIYNQ